MRINKYIISVFIGFLFFSCSKENIEIDDDFSKCKPLGFSSLIETKGEVATIDNISTMGVYGYYTALIDFNGDRSIPNFFSNKLMEKTEKWEYSPLKYWPYDENEKMSFFAYSPYASVDNGISVPSEVIGTPNIIYTMPLDVVKQPDMIVAVPLKNVTNTIGNILFKFHHVLSSVSFKVKGNGEKISSIAITGISTKGQLSLDLGLTGADIKWLDFGFISNNMYNSGLNFDEGMNYVTATADMTRVTSENGSLMVIPQNISSSAKIIVTYDGGKTKEIGLSGFLSKFSAGERYVLNLVM